MDEKKEVSLVRPYDFCHKQYHINKWRELNITVLVCQRKTKDLISLCLESILRFYPDIPILIVDGNSQDESSVYIKQKTIKNENISVWNRDGINSHGLTMDEAIVKYIKTRYVLLCDSDIVIERGGIIEDMLNEFKKDSNIYAIGSLMLVTRSGHACGPPKSEDDILRYAHPSFSIYDTKIYHELNAPFTDHGAPCVYNMLEAEKRNLTIAYYPVDKYVSHLCGGSWTIPRVVWGDDHDVHIRPFVTFIIDNPIHIDKLKQQTDHDFDIVTTCHIEQQNIVINGFPQNNFSNNLYDIRFNICGEYICNIPNELIVIQPHFVAEIKRQTIDSEMPEEINVGGLICVSRKLWQKREAVK